MRIEGIRGYSEACALQDAINQAVRRNIVTMSVGGLGLYSDVTVDELKVMSPIVKAAGAKFCVGGLSGVGDDRDYQKLKLAGEVE